MDGFLSFVIPQRFQVIFLKHTSFSFKGVTSNSGDLRRFIAIITFTSCFIAKFLSKPEDQGQNTLYLRNKILLRTNCYFPFPAQNIPPERLECVKKHPPFNLFIPSHSQFGAWPQWFLHALPQFLFTAVRIVQAGYDKFCYRKVIYLN